jgi:hypothetical protein
MAESRPRPFAHYAIGAVVLCTAVVALLRWCAAPEPKEDQQPRRGRATTQDGPEWTACGSATSRSAPLPSTTTAPPAKRGRGEAVIQARWGSGKGELGLSRPEEANPEAPMSFALDATGRTWIIDQVNGRLVTYGPDGTVLGESQLAQRVPQDIAIGADGTMALLDRLGDKTVAVYGPDGTLRGAIPLEGKGIPETGAVTGVFVDGDDVYAEVEHGTLVNVGHTDGTPDGERQELPGRPSRDGRLLLSAGITQAQEGRMWVSAVRRNPIAHQFTRELRVSGEILYLLLLDSDRLGAIYVAAQHMPASRGTPLLTLTCMEPEHGEPIGSVDLPANTSADETFREMTVLDEGGVVYGVRTEEGIAYRYYPCP